MKNIFAVVFLFSSFSYAEKMDWKVCEKELQEFCTTATDDHEKHECLEEAPKGKVSKNCFDFNSKLDGKFQDKHNHKKKDKHGHRG